MKRFRSCCQTIPEFRTQVCLRDDKSIGMVLVACLICLGPMLCFLNIFAEKLGGKIGEIDTNYSYLACKKG
jgi:hypothetical protein